jgi:hypothetical protein
LGGRYWGGITGVATNLVPLRQNGYGKRNFLQGFRHGLATKNKMNCFIIASLFANLARASKPY